MPRFRGESTGAEGGGGGSEQDGGPEHVVSFDALMTWPDVKVMTTSVIWLLIHFLKLDCFHMCQ